MIGRTLDHLIFVLCFAGGLAVSTAAAAAQTVPTGYKIPDITLSPDHRYGVTVPDLDTPNPHNSLIEIKTGRVLAVIQADTGYERANHINLLPPAGPRTIHSCCGKSTANGSIRPWFF